jgi:hypothetical protein
MASSCVIESGGGRSLGKVKSAAHGSRTVIASQTHSEVARQGVPGHPDLEQHHEVVAAHEARGQTPAVSDCLMRATSIASGKRCCSAALGGISCGGQLQRQECVRQVLGLDRRRPFL